MKVDRSGLNVHHPIVAGLYHAIDGVLRPIVAAEERRAGAHLIGAPRAVTARDQVGLRAPNDLLKAAFDQPGGAAAEPGSRRADKPPARPAEHEAGAEPTTPEERAPASRSRPLKRCGSSGHRFGFIPARGAWSRCPPTRSGYSPEPRSRSRPTLA